MNLGLRSMGLGAWDLGALLDSGFGVEPFDLGALGLLSRAIFKFKFNDSDQRNEKIFFPERNKEETPAGLNPGKIIGTSVILPRE